MHILILQYFYCFVGMVVVLSLLSAALTVTFGESATSAGSTSVTALAGFIRVLLPKMPNETSEEGVRDGGVNPNDVNKLSCHL